MSMKPQPIPEIPPETVRVVGAAFPKGNLYIHLRDTLGTIYQDELFADLFPDIHAVLDQRDLLPEQHIVDAGYVDAELLVASQTQYQVDLVGPTGKDHRWQARQQTGYALPRFLD